MGHRNWFGRGVSLQIAISAVCTVAFILFGYDQGVFSGIVGAEDFLTTVNHPDPSLLGIIVSIYNLGCFTGCIINFLIGDRLGRRMKMWIAMGFVIVSGPCRSAIYADMTRLGQPFKLLPRAWRT